MTKWTIEAIEAELCAEIARLLEIDRDEVQPEYSLGELGMDSLGFVELSRFLQRHFERKIPPEALYEHPSIHHTAQCVVSEAEGREQPEPTVERPLPEQGGVAIVGASFRLPGADGWDSLDALLAGEPHFDAVPSHRWPSSGGSALPATLKAGVLDDVARFDAAFFGISPREALAMDPQQRLLMECAWRAMEDAGLEPAQWQGSRTSVFVGASSFDYAELLQRTGAGRSTHIGTGLSHAILANRLSQYFNLRGSSEAIDTACSSSLVALWRAVTELRAGTAERALVAGVNVFASETPFRAFAEAGMLSPNGACLPFDLRANGYVRGEGVVALVLKPLNRAEEDGDRIWGVIRGGAVRHSGRTQSLTAPNPEAQADVVLAALEDAGVEAADIGYVEAHGTGTSLGDPIEIRGLKKAFRNANGTSDTADASPCRLGTIKSQIGHLEAAAGLAGVVKILHCFRHNRLPPNPHLASVNPLIDLKESRLSLATDAADWPLPTTTDGRLPARLAGVSSFGFGGTNAHLILQQAPEHLRRDGDEREARVFQGERYWPRFETSNPAPLQSLECLQSRWSTQALPADLEPSSLAPTGTAWIIQAGERGRAVADALLAQLPSLRGDCIDWSNLEAHWQRQGTAPDVWIDLSALDEPADGNGDTAAARLGLMGEVLGPALKQGAQLNLVQATANLQDLSDRGYPCQSLAGAGLNAVYDSLSAEYRHCRSKSVDFAGQAKAPERIARALADELQPRAVGRAVAYIDDTRLVSSLEPCPLPELDNPTVLANAVVVVTGGLGDIGRQLTNDLVDKGVSAILLTGRREPTADDREWFDGLRQAGVDIDYYQGALTDEPSLATALNRFRQSQGEITHLFHCAGFVDDDNLAFYKKSRSSVARVFEPKVASLDALHRYFKDRLPNAVVLFSSLSAADPESAVGVLDYAAANRYLDIYAAYRNRDCPGVYRSIQWDAWQTTGMGRKTQQGIRGRAGLTSGSALAVLHAVVSQPSAGGPLCVRSMVTAEEPGRKPSGNSPRQTESPAGTPVNADELLPELRALIARELETDESRLDDHAAFTDLGIDSIVLMDVIRGIEKWLGKTVDPNALIQCNSIAATADYLANQTCASTTAPMAAMAGSTTASAENQPEKGPFKVAVIGMACHVPGANDLPAFWRNLLNGVDSVVSVPPEQRRDRPAEEGESPRWAGLIEGYEGLYPQLFGMSPDEAADVDPLVRLFTECSLAAIHDSAVGLEGVKGRRVGVFAGSRASRYAERIHQPGKRSITGVGQNFIAAYLSHLLDLRGPNMVLDTACSSSLTALHLACQSLRSGDSELAVAGGVDVLLDQQSHRYLNSAKALSPDGRCRPFSARANGFVPGEGVGAVLLKPLDRALADRDPIYAVIDGSAINNDGETLGITTPGADGQADVIRRALENSQVSARDISYVEAHGTGTMIGDPIELQSLSRAYQDDPPSRCGVGSVKSNLGHLLSAAGIASFIKVALSLHHQQLPPTLHCDEVNPRIGFDRLPFYPVTTAQPWPAGQGGRKAGISAFGFGKTNVHLILSERPQGALVPELRSRALPPSLCGERVRAWHDAVPAARSTKPPSDPPLMAVMDVVVEEVS